VGSQPLPAYADRIQAANGLVTAGHSSVLRRPSSGTCDGLLFTKAVTARGPLAPDNVTPGLLAIFASASGYRTLSLKTFGGGPQGFNSPKWPYRSLPTGYCASADQLKVGCSTLLQP
jgi:hypothetical protein